LGALYYAAIWSVCVMVVVLGYLVACRFRPGPRLGRSLAIMGVVTVALVAPLAPAYFHVQRSEHLTRGYYPEFGLRLTDLVSPAPRSDIYPGLARAADARPKRAEHAYFPGFVVLGLAAVGVGALAVRRWHASLGPVVPERLTHIVLLMSAGIVAAVV